MWSPAVAAAIEIAICIFNHKRPAPSPPKKKTLVAKSEFPLIDKTQLVTRITRRIRDRRRLFEEFTFSKRKRK